MEGPRDGQGKQQPRRPLAAMLTHAARHSPYYREQDWAKCLREGATIRFGEIPITAKSTVKAGPTSFFAGFVPPAHGELHLKHTSGSTGEPQPVRKTDEAMRRNSQENFRLKRGWGFARQLRSIEVVSHDEHYPNGTVRERAGTEGRRAWTIYTADGDAVFELARRTSATMISTFPSVIWRVLERNAGAGRPLALKLILTMSEIVPDELRRLAAEIPDCRLADFYGCVEAGLIAAQCPLCGAYHPADRHLLVELVAEDGRPAASGEMGRVVVTPLFNRAMPLVRYETGDYAIAGARRDCPRSPFAIARIVGRERNLFKHPDGRKISPGLPAVLMEQLGLHRFKLLQTSLGEIELRYVPRLPGTEVAQAVAQELVDRYLAPGFRVLPVRVEEIPRAPSGKYFMHESLV
jgi:phenylacetate-CoA ligase